MRKEELEALKSIMFAYREVYYVRLDEDYYCMVHPDINNTEECGNYGEAIYRHFVTGKILDEDKKNVENFLKADNIKKALVDKDYIEYRYRRRTKNNYDWCLTSFTIAERSNDGIPKAVTMSIRSIDDVIKKEEETKQLLSNALKLAENASMAKSDFLSKMSHDIRTPLNAIIGMTAIASTHIDKKECVEDCLKKITSASRHLLALINEILDMSKIEAGKLNLAQDEFNLSDLIENLLNMIKPSIKEKRHELDVNISGIEHEDVIGDSLRIQQAFVNIMGNAIKYTDNGGKISLSISERPVAQKGVGCYEFIFEDNGIGMTKEFVKRMFEPFERERDVRIDRIEGTGLGMTITKNIVNMMDGDIKVESEADKGTKITVTICLKLQDKEKLSDKKFGNISILVADSDENVCKSTCLMLEELGIKSEWVLSGSAAVKKVKEAYDRRENYYAVIADRKLPEMDGIMTAKEIRRITEDEMPVIIISAYDWLDIEMEARAAGADAFVGKPLFKSRLKRMLEEISGVENAAANGGTLSIDEHSYTGKRILIVEDNDLNREIAKEILEMTGLEAEEAENGKIALDMVIEKPAGYYDLIFMDIQMPEMNGYETTIALRSMPRKDLHKIPIIAMTANAFAEDVQTAKNCGMNEHIAKPLDIERLLSVLDYWLRQ